MNITKSHRKPAYVENSAHIKDRFNILCFTPIHKIHKCYDNLAIIVDFASF